MDQVHTLALTDEGRVYSFGGGSYGQLGVKDCDCRIFSRVWEFRGQVCSQKQAVSTKRVATPDPGLS